MIYLLLIAATFWGVGSAYTVDDCPAGLARNDNLKVFGSNCYRFVVNEKQDFQEAQDICKKDGGNLALVKDNTINNFIIETILQQYAKYKKNHFWIGLHFVNDSYQWVDGSNLEYSDLKSNDVHYMRHDCIYLRPSTRFWEHGKCKTSVHGLFDPNSRRYVCEYPVIHTFTAEDCPESLARDKTLTVLDGKCYKFEGNDFKTFDNAERDCNQNGGNLVSVNSIDVNQHIRNELFTTHNDIVSQTEVWIGLKYSSYDDAFTWTDNTPTNYNNFRNYENGDNLCVAMSPIDGEWDTKECVSTDDNNFDIKLPYMCEYQALTPDSKFPSSITKDDCPIAYDNDKIIQLLGNKCYLFETKSRYTFTDAEAFCERFEGTLAMSKSSKTNEFLFHHLHHTHNLGFESDPVWIGLSFVNSSHAYRWVDGTALNYTNFMFDERYKECVAMAPINGKWQEAKCGAHLDIEDKKYYICEFEINTGTNTVSSKPMTTNAATTKATTKTITKATTKAITKVTTKATTKAATKAATKATTETTTNAPTETTNKTTTNAPIETTTPPITTPPAPKSTCPSIICELDCALDGYRQSAKTGCMVCECDD